MSTESKSLRWSFRVAEADDAVVRAASESVDATVTSFVREAAVSQANRVLADRTRFELGSTEWEQLNELLDRPARVRSELRELFSRPSAFD